LKTSSDDDALWSNLALELYLAGAYKDAAAASAKVVALAPGDGDAKVMAALCALLNGDTKAAEQFASTVPEGVQPERALALWYIAGKSEKAAVALAKFHNATPDKKLQESLDALLGRTNPAPKVDPSYDYVAQCRTFCYAGYRHWLAGKTDEAKKFFAEALKTLQLDRPEFRLAQVALERLPK